MKLYFARHGETIWNHRDVVCGRTDIPLTQRGLEQAAELAEQVAGTQVDLILASPLIRAQQTAQAVADRIGVEIITESLLIEQDFGAFEEAPRSDPEYLSCRNNFFRRFPGGGESIAMVTARAYQVIEKVRTQYADRTVLLVGHGAFSRTLRTWFVDTANEEFFRTRLLNCQLAEFELE